MKLCLARCAGALAAVVLLASVVVPGSALAQVADEDAFRSFVEGVRNGRLPPAVAARECQRELAAQETVEDVREIMAGYLEVPESQALGTFCESLVQAAEVGAVTPETASIIGRRQMDADFFHAFGRLMRAVHFARQPKAADLVDTQKP